MITYIIQRGNAGFFWSRFHAVIYNSLRISTSKNQTWLRPAWDFTGMIFIRILPNKIHAL